MVIKPISEMENYEVAFSGITDEEWYYDRDRMTLKKQLEYMIKSQDEYTKKLIKK